MIGGYMKKWKTIVCLSVMMLCLVACDGEKRESLLETEEIASEIISETESIEEFVSPESLQSQLKIMAKSMDLWNDSYKSDLYFNRFTVTDLDRNGRYELIIAQMAGSGHYTDGKFYEVNETYDTLVECERVGRKGYGYTTKYESSEWADFIVDETTMYYDAKKDIYYYLFEDYKKDGLSWRRSCWQVLYIKDGALYEETIATMEASWDEKGEGTFGYWDSKGNEITEEAYANLVANPFPELEPQTVYFDWGHCNELYEIDEMTFLTELEELFAGMEE